MQVDYKSTLCPSWIVKDIRTKSCASMTKEGCVWLKRTAESRWVRICLRCFQLGMVWNREMLYRHCFSTLLWSMPLRGNDNFIFCYSRVIWCCVFRLFPNISHQAVAMYEQSSLLLNSCYNTHTYITMFLCPLQYSNFTRNTSPTRRDETQAINIQTIPTCTYTWTIDTRQSYQNTDVTPSFIIEAHDFVLISFTIHEGHNVLL